MILALTTYSCRVRGCRETWAIAEDGSFAKDMWLLHAVERLKRDNHEIHEHSENQYDEVLRYESA